MEETVWELENWRRGIWELLSFLDLCDTSATIRVYDDAPAVTADINEMFALEFGFSGSLFVFILLVIPHC
jgi:predicted transcriptional regulator